MRAIQKLPGKPAEVVELDNTLPALQKAVGGRIESVSICQDAAFLVNEEGILLGLPLNVTVCGLKLFGPLLVVGVREDEFTDLSPVSTSFLMEMLERCAP